MATEGFLGFHIETRNYGATAAFWRSLGFASVFETGPEYARRFDPQHWGVVEALVVDPDGRPVSLQAPLPDGIAVPDIDSHHEQKYG